MRRRTCTIKPVNDASSFFFKSLPRPVSCLSPSSPCPLQLAAAALGSSIFTMPPRRAPSSGSAIPSRASSPAAADEDEVSVQVRDRVAQLTRGIDTLLRLHRRAAIACMRSCHKCALKVDHDSVTQGINVQDILKLKVRVNRCSACTRKY